MQVELQHRVKPGTTPPDSARTSDLVNHIGAEMVKKEPESTTEACAQKNCPTASTIWPHSGQQNHRNPMMLQEMCMTSSEKSSFSITSSALTDTPPKGNQEHDSTKLRSSSPTPGTPSLSK